MGKKVFVCFYEAYPPDSGAGTVSYCMASHTAGERMLIQVCDRDEMIRQNNGLVVRSLRASFNTKAGKILGLLPILGQIIEILREFAAEVVILEGASWVVYHYLLMRRIGKIMPGTRVIYHSHNVEYELRRSKNGPLVAAITRWAEGRVLAQADRCYAVSNVDAEIFDELYGVRPELLPNGVDVQRYGSVKEKAKDDIRSKYGIGSKALLFMGLYMYRPNTEAVDFLINKVMPEVIGRDSDVQLVITGGKVPYSFPWLVGLGMLPYEEMPALVGACAVGLAPVFSGSGTRLKILEYMAGGLPVISTVKGAEGLEVEDRSNILLAEKSEDFVQAVTRLLTDKKLASELSASGNSLVSETYDWPVIVKRISP